MLVTPYLISMAMPESPRPLVEGATTSWFQVYLREFNYRFRAGGAPWPPTVEVGPSDYRGRGKHHRAVGACVAQDTADTSINRLLS